MKIGFAELLIIFIVALFVIGPDKLPYYMQQFGKALAQFRHATDEATKEIRESIVDPLEEAQKPLKEALEPLNDFDKAIKDNAKEITGSINNIGKPKKSEKKAEKKDSELALEAELLEARKKLAELEAELEKNRLTDEEGLSQTACDDAADEINVLEGAVSDTASLTGGETS